MEPSSFLSQIFQGMWRINTVRKLPKANCHLKMNFLFLVNKFLSSSSAFSLLWSFFYSFLLHAKNQSYFNVFQKFSGKLSFCKLRTFKKLCVREMFLAIFRKTFFIFRSFACKFPKIFNFQEFRKARFSAKFSTWGFFKNPFLGPLSIPSGPFRILKKTSRRYNCTWRFVIDEAPKNQ